MLALGPLAFATPWMLAALATLPVLWWLLRVTPPSPRLLAFPPIRLILALRPQEETPARTPLWLVIMRMVLAALIILALAGPLLNPGAKLRGNGPLVLVVDDSWAAAVNWQARRTVIDSLIDRAAREDRPVRVLTTARRPAGDPHLMSDLLRAAEAQRLVRTIVPRPWPADRRAALAALDGIQIDGSAHVAWLSDGLGDDHATTLAERLQALGSLTVHTEPDAATARLVLTPKSGADGLTVPVVRASGAGGAEMWLRASAQDGRLVAREKLVFENRKTRAETHLKLPGELRNAVVRIEIEGETTAGATVLLDERWRRRPIGLLSGDTQETAQPLLGSLYYLERAMKPFAEVRRGSLDDLLRRELAVLVLADIGKLTKNQTERLRRWMSLGGVIVRFAGPKLAQTADGLIPVRLRGGDRALGGAMSWSRPARLAPFDTASPFASLPIPGDVRIRRQVLAEPSIDLNAKTWARLTDGTPLVTAEKRGRGRLILIHTTANTDWSNMPMSGLFVGMLRRIVGLSQGVVSEDATLVFPPIETLDGLGRLGAPPATATAIPGQVFGDARAGPRTPPGFYGRDAARRALNLSAGSEGLRPLGELAPGVEHQGYDKNAVIDFVPWLLLAALILALVDLVVSFALRGLLPARVFGGAGVAVIAVLLSAAATPGHTQSGASGTFETVIPEGPDRQALLATLETRLAYVLTGDGKLDEVSRAGLEGLTRVLRRRTAVEPGAPLAVDIEADELAFFPLLYWPVSSQQRPLSDGATAKLNDYLRRGGTILFDTRERGDFNSDPFGRGGGRERHMRLLLRGLDIPTLIPLPRDHVLTKSFYLLSQFPGRWSGGKLWVERRGGRHNDGVSSVVIGSNDWAGAWSVDSFGNAMFAVVPGGEMQREMAYRFGVNWVMYALTGNYKTDQVHVPAIIERLGQ